MALRHNVSFMTPMRTDCVDIVLDHFPGLGYRLVGQRPGHWDFHRGSKLASLYRLDIRAYSTQLHVCLEIQRVGGLWVNCDFEVWTLTNYVFPGDKARLEREGRALESQFRH